MDKSRQDRLILKLINRALNTANEEKILFLLSRMINRQNKSHFATRSGLNRVSLYRVFLSRNSPKLDTVLKAMDALGLQLRCSVKIMEKSPPTEYASMTASTLSAAFATNSLEAISRGFGDAVHRQANIAEFARRVSISRMSLYRWLQPGNALNFRSVLKITLALGLRLEVEWRSNENRPNSDQNIESSPPPTWQSENHGS